MAKERIKFVYKIILPAIRKTGKRRDQRADGRALPPSAHCSPASRVDRSCV
uniref:BRO-J n=1 Tax=Lymantria dispar multicapsid nuclear polyhedrosis virus TaxID=10449 RepID=V9TII6_NPVLD|nr:BRO-J [Lymantria dispar multiple nucleopolyhedrovirus]